MRRFLSVLVALAVAGTGYAVYKNNTQFKTLVDGFTGNAPPVVKAKKQMPPAPVRIALVGQRTVPIKLEGVGNVQARSTIAIKARVDGQLMEAAVQEGQKVKKGDLLFRLDTRPFEAQLRQAEANLARDKANLDKAITDQARFESLSQKGISPKTKLEEAVTSVAALRAQIRASEAAVELAKLNNEYAVIRAPIDGRVGSILQAAGNMVKANDTQAILMLTEVSPIHAAFALPEQHIQDLRARLRSAEPITVEVRPQGDEATTEHGKLFFINNAVDPTTGTILVMARFDNAEERLVPGQFIKASVLMATLSNAVVIDTKALQINQKGHYVWVVKPDKSVELRSVEIGPEAGQSTVITRGLKVGETIVLDGQLRLYPGAKVAPIDNAKPKTTKGTASVDAKG